MKRNRIHHYFGWLALSTLLLTTACAGIADLDVESKNVSGSNTVTFTIQSQAQTSGMRGAEDALTTNNTVISRGDSANVLIFAVYKVEEQDGNKKYTVAEQFGKEDLTKGNKFKDKLSKGQTAIDVDQYPITLQFLIEDDGTYQVVFWAQSSETEAYDTKDLKKVEVKYSKTVDGKQVNFLNNTENRDAFCAVSEEITAATKTMQTVTLTRPLAQVNVGTAGWDYEGAAVLRPGSVSFNQSKMTLKGVARYYDVLNGRTLKKTELKLEDGEATTDVTFDYYRLPAFINVDKSEWSQPRIHPYYREPLLEEEGDSIQVEEFLTIDLDKNSTITEYKGWDFYNDYRQKNQDFLDNGTLPDTEQFKYLSMCYVLVPEAETGTSSDTVKDTEIAGDASGNSTVNVDFTFKGVERTDDGFGGEYEFDQTYEVANVPVKKNWRTNLLSKNFFTYSTTFTIDVVPEYCGDYNYDSSKWGNPSEGDSWPLAYYYSIVFGYNGSKHTFTKYTNDENYKSKDYFTLGSNSGGNSKDKFGTGVYTSEKLGVLKFDTGALNLNSSAEITFKTDSVATLIVVHSVKSTETDTMEDGTTKSDPYDVDCNGGFRLVNVEKNDTTYHHLSSAKKNPAGCSGVWVHTVSNLPPGKYKILNDKLDEYPKGQKNPKVQKTLPFINGLFYIEVAHQKRIKEETEVPNGDFDDEHDDDYYGNKD